MIGIIYHERGIPSKRMSSTYIEYVPALCTHRPSLLPIECTDELWGYVHWYVEPPQILVFRGSTSRNKVSVGEPADGSLQLKFDTTLVVESVHFNTVFCIKQNQPILLKTNLT